MASGQVTDTGVLASVEVRSIDYVPLSERKGLVTDQATIWFAGSAHLLTLATGAIGILEGLDLGWTLIALAIGTAVGTIPVSAHATQGPHLGLPQMVQSRPQFGRYGALYIWLMAIAVYWGYVVIDGNLLGATASQLGGGSAPVWAVIVVVISVALAIFGYHWLHIAQRYIALALIIVTLVYIIGLAALGKIPGDLFDLGHSFTAATFMVVVSASAAYQLTWAFFVSDYSRYMPPTVSKRAIIAYTSGGLFFGLYSFLALGAVCASLLPKADIVSALNTTGDYIFDGFGPVMLVVGALGLLGLTGMCVYGGSLTLITALDSIWTVNPTRRIRLITILVVGVTGAAAAAEVPSDFLNTQFATVLAVLAYLMAPWTAVNLTDFFIIRRGRYSVREIFSRHGIYGLWNWRGLTAYGIAFAVTIPFENLTFWHGPVATALGGVDIAFFVGIPVGVASYWLLARNLNVTREAAVIAAADRDLDAIAVPVE